MTKKQFIRWIEMHLDELERQSKEGCDGGAGGGRVRFKRVQACSRSSVSLALAGRPVDVISLASM
jgi:hypothetical protein